MKESLPLWCGFNILEKFQAEDLNLPFNELDFKRASQWGFNFFRLPMDYRCWIIDRDPYKINEKVLSEIDEAVALGKKYGIHLNLCFHRAPGYSVNRIAIEPFNLWEDEEAQAACEFHWRLFSKRYKGIPNTLLSFNLVNEPYGTTMSLYKRFVERMVEAIRNEDKDRLIIVDGLIMPDGHYAPVPDVSDPLVGQSFHMYEPPWITHIMASWWQPWGMYNEQPKYPGEAPNLDKYLAELPPESPLRGSLQRWKGVYVDRNWLENWMRPWFEFRDETGTLIHCGELGVYTFKVPRQTQLNWFSDVLNILKENRVGWAVWNLRGSFGIINTGREEFHSETLPNGDRLDRELLNLLRSSVR
ncbi:MAG: cellulase family glycosylhydrolase [Thermoproteota archaeon]